MTRFIAVFLTILVSGLAVAQESNEKRIPNPFDGCTHCIYRTIGSMGSCSPETVPLNSPCPGKPGCELVAEVDDPYCLINFEPIQVMCPPSHVSVEMELCIVGECGPYMSKVNYTSKDKCSALMGAKLIAGGVCDELVWYRVRLYNSCNQLCACYYCNPHQKKCGPLRRLFARLRK